VTVVDAGSRKALDVEVIEGKRIGRVHGAPDQPYTAGVVCAKVARYAERIHHPDRLTHPLRRVGPKGSGQFAAVSWDEALDRVAEAFLKAEREHSAESVWPYFYAGTMGLVMRDGIERLTHAKRYSRFFGTICVGIAWPGFIAGTGRMSGVSADEIAKSDCVVIWGTNAVATQVNLMTHAIRARKERGAKIVAIDIYQTETMRQADLALRHGKPRDRVHHQQNILSGVAEILRDGHGEKRAFHAVQCGFVGRGDDDDGFLAAIFVEIAFEKFAYFTAAFADERDDIHVRFRL